MTYSEFKDKVVLVTGASGGIGSAVCREFISAEAKVYQTDIVGTHNPGFIQGDISDTVFIRNLVGEVVEKEGRIDILVNNAGICPRTSILNITPEEWRKVMDVNLTSTFFLSQAVIEIMIKNNSGAIVNLASIAGKIGGVAVGAHYSASKAAIECLTKTFAKYGAPYGIRVNAVAPGVIDTDIHKTATPEQLEQYYKLIPLGRMGTPKEVADVILMLASGQASYLTGAVIDINGGQRM
jgi:NAD(P)-dependent dehydrogenase (short-subunit alcohol dehydrogenase family)